MDGEQKFWLSLWAIIGLAVVLTTSVICASVCINNKNAFAAGYERQQKQGTTDSVWAKVK